MRPATLAPPLLLAARILWAPQESGSTAELRGLAVRDASHAWASGSGGTVLRTRDGEHWEKLTVPGGESLDFRDVEALDDRTLLLLAVGPGDQSRIYRSADAGGTWTLAHANPDKDGFYDAIAFWDSRDGLVLGDPVNGRFVLRATHDGGASWAAVAGASIPEARPGEGAFAASGTCLTALPGGREAWFVTGGSGSGRVFRTADRGRTWTAADTPVPAPNASSGLFSVAFLDARRGFTVGGDYKQPTLAGLNGARTEDGGVQWIAAPVAPSGFLSAVTAVPGARDGLVAAGPHGVFRSDDGGRTWESQGTAPVNAVALEGSGGGWAVGPKGTILRSRPSIP